MLHLLNDTLQNYLISHRRTQIQAIAADADRSRFFNKLLRSRNINSSSQRELLSTIMEAIDAAYSVEKEALDFELVTWYGSRVDKHGGIPASSSLLNSKTYIGFEHLND
jgi:sulfopyruvate decarboxylase TPP-binding subunit